jgi:SAM-dependent methyltransferase
LAGLSPRVESAARRFARVATRAVVAKPGLWRVFRGPLRKQFDWLASGWEERRGPEMLAPLEAALDRLPEPPRRVLDIGTGTGKAARVAAQRFPDAQIFGVDLSGAMIEEARRLLPADLANRVRFQVADGAALPFVTGEFDLVMLFNMIPFFDELARVTSRGGHLLFAFSNGPGTPIYVPPATLRERLAPLGFTDFEEVAAGDGTAFLAVRKDPG